MNLVLQRRSLRPIRVGQRVAGCAAGAWLRAGARRRRGARRAGQAPVDRSAGDHQGRHEDQGRRHPRRSWSWSTARSCRNVNFQRMTALGGRPAWRKATPEQQKRLQDEFRTLLVRTYAGALARSATRRSMSSRCAAARRHRRGGAHRDPRPRRPVQLDYRLEKTPGEGAGWKVYNVNVLRRLAGRKLPQRVRQEISSKGIDGLITTLAERNKQQRRTKR